MIDTIEKNIIKIAIKHKSNPFNVVDVGGFQGNWSDEILAADNQSKIVIFEPNEDNFTKLQNKYLNNKNIQIINKGASNKNDKLVYYELSSKEPAIRGMSGFVLRNIYKTHGFSEKIIEVVKIDDMLDIDIDLMKIDTEGFEFNVLMGCERLLSEHKIKFLQFEYGGTYLDYNIKLNDVISYLRKFDYLVYSVDNDGNISRIDNFKDDYSYNNFLATHMEINYVNKV